MYHSALLGALSTVFTFASAKQAACAPKSVKIPEIYGVEILNIRAHEVKEYDSWQPMATAYGLDFDQAKSIDFCNVTVTYTHPNTGDNVNVYIWLPLKDWNERYLTVGGGGFSGGFEGTQAAGVANGFASANTDTGHSYFDMSVKPWIMKSPGNPSYQQLYDFAGVALDDMTKIAKATVQSFYGKPPKYSYFSGCSGGGRQGLIHAQRYPKNYDGILAMAPGIDFSDLMTSMYWAFLKMNQENYYPPPCEVIAIHDAVIDACDALDMVKDGFISNYTACTFDANDAVGLPCCGGTSKVTKKAAKVVNALWEGVRQDGRQLIPGSVRSMALATEVEALKQFGGLAQTQCKEDNTNCKPLPFLMVKELLETVLNKDPNFDIMKMTEEEYLERLKLAQQQFKFLDSRWPDLSSFRKAGGKMITWHGLADQLLSPEATASYYKSVLAEDPDAASYYRYFEVPGIEHCFGGSGFFPTDAWQKLVDWVEKGQAPEALAGRTLNVEEKDAATRPLCPYPEVPRYKGGDVKKTASYECSKNGFGDKLVDAKQAVHEEL